ncbi:hypothetical protein BY458DRAFT_461973 [Sporodiniella umbellata]|nr:hypothetical protein BY458DRAFT_461973 [Sporodiniella umbellata]
MSNTINNSSFNGPTKFIINPKRERDVSPSPYLSDESISPVYVKRTVKTNYFLGKGSKCWKPREQLLVQNIDITEALRRFRKRSVIEADNGNDLNSLRVLSLSHLFPINKFDNEKCVARYFHGNAREALNSIASSMIPKFERTPAKAVVYCKNKIDVIAESEEEEKKEKEDMMSMVKCLVRHEAQFIANIADCSEASFMDRYLMPAIRRVLLQDVGKDILYALIDKPNKDGKRPDFMIGTKVKSKDLYFFFVEVKRPKVMSRYQPEDDYTKLMKQMKGSVDDQLCLGVENPLSLGLLVEGYTCTLFQTAILADGVYIPMAINSFSLVEHHHHLVHIPSIVEAFFFIKRELNNFVAKVNEKRTKEEKTVGKERVRFSFETKLETKKKRTKKAL